MSHANIRLFMVLVVVVFAGACSKDNTQAQPITTATGPTKTSPAAAPISEPADPPPAPSKLDVVLTKTTLSDALEVVKPLMTDTNDDMSPGALLLAVWAAKHLKWADVGVVKNETSAALVRKDSDANRAKRMCTRGQIIQIRKEKAGDSTLFTGLMLSGYSELTQFIAVGSTGELVEQSGARFCGVVSGTYDYSNSGGGKGHAITIVGMFDLPENRPVK